jgi:hypothetical protein
LCSKIKYLLIHKPFTSYIFFLRSGNHNHFARKIILQKKNRFSFLMCISATAQPNQSGLID